MTHLSKNEKYNFYFVFLDAISKIRKYEKKLIRESNLKVTPNMAMYMTLLNTSPNMSQKDLLPLLDVSKGTLSNMISSLVKKGYIVSKVNPKDKRITNYLITKKGEKVVELNNIIRKNIRKKLLKEATAQQVDSFFEMAYRLRNIKFDD